MKTVKLTFLLLAILFVAVNSSCSKDEEENTQDATTAIINVSLVDGGYGTVANINVDLTESGGTEVQEKVTGASGEITFEGVLPGTYYLHAYKEGEHHIAYSDNFQVAAGETENVSLTLD
jgi:hypothetical protein